MNLVQGTRLAVIGENGSGKSTLLRLISGEMAPTSGDIQVSSRPVYVRQEQNITKDDTTVAEQLEKAIAPFKKIEDRLTQASKDLGLKVPGAEEAYSTALRTAEVQDIWSAPQRLERYIYSLGISTIPRKRNTANLSAGQRKRLEMAIAMIGRPAILLLDEPSNYLDEHARQFIAEEIKKWKGIVVFATHDRTLLSNVPTQICDLDRSWYSKYVYKGNYSNYLLQKQKEEHRWTEDYYQQQEEIRQLKEALATKARKVSHGRAMTDHNKKAYGARGDRVESQISRRVKAAKEKLDRIESSRIPAPPVPLLMSVVPPKKKNDSVPAQAVQMREVTVNDRLSRPFTLDVSVGDKIIMEGANGSGKTTVLELINKSILPSTGRITTAQVNSVAYLGHRDLYAEDHRTARMIYNAATPTSAQAIMDMRILQEIDTEACYLSNGQRKRLELAIALQSGADILLLDEPTNHLSPTFCDQLFDLLTSWPSAVIIATHEFWLKSSSGWRTITLPLC